MSWAACLWLLTTWRELPATLFVTACKPDRFHLFRKPRRQLGLHPAHALFMSIPDVQLRQALVEQIVLVGRAGLLVEAAARRSEAVAC